MADYAVEKVSRCSDNAQISCLTPVNHVLTDTSNLTKKSISSDKKEYPIKQKEPTVDVKQESSTLNNEEKNDYEIGDIVWAKIGRYPFWPSIVCIDPESNLYIKGSLKDKRKFSIHVRFCNDNGRRSWAKTIENYYGKEALLSKYPNCLGFIKGSKKQMTVWDLAVKEADNWLKTDRENRVAKFSQTNGLGSSKISGLGPTPSSSKSTVVEKRVASTSSSSHINLSSRDYLRKLMAECVEGSSVTYETDREASTSDSAMVFVEPKNKSNGNSTEQPITKAVKRKFVDEKKKQLREALKIKKAKRALQVKKYGFSYSSSEYESTDDEAPPLVPFDPKRKVLVRIKSEIINLESKGMKETKERRIKIKAIRFAERNSDAKKKNNEDTDEQE